jgi:asparagine synthase (glutamine-hydrolysing)
MMAVDAVTYLPDDILVKVDRAAMAVSLETRVPLLARSVVEFAATLPVGMKLGPGGGKPVLRELIRRHVPDQLTQRPKAGFGVPIGAWLRGPLRPWAAGRLDVAADTGALQMGPIRAAWEDHQSGVADHSFRLWDVVMFAAWFEARTGAVQARARRRAAMYERSGNATPVR